jgi:hypothetical protein
MNSHLLSKFAICAAAFVINALMLAGVDYVFNGKLNQRSPWASLVQTEGGAAQQQGDIQARRA